MPTAKNSVCGVMMESASVEGEKAAGVVVSRFCDAGQRNSYPYCKQAPTLRNMHRYVTRAITVGFFRDVFLVDEIIVINMGLGIKCLDRSLISSLSSYSILYSTSLGVCLIDPEQNP